MIGVFDSGMGGLSVLLEIRRLLPKADLVYLADQDNAPYGDRILDDVRRLAERCTSHLIAAGADVVVVACNTARQPRCTTCALSIRECLSLVWNRPSSQLRPSPAAA